MRLATQYDRIHAAGAEFAAVSVDDDVRQAGMARRWGLSHSRMVSDPGGERYLKPLDLFNPGERNGIALPGMIIVDPDGNEVYRYQGRDFADRTNDDDLWETLAGLGGAPVDPPPWTPDVDVPDDLRGFFRPRDFGPYFRGNFYGSVAIEMRLTDADSAAIAHQHGAMSKANVDAYDAWREHIER